jgi:hypothetical protein
MRQFGSQTHECPLQLSSLPDPKIWICILKHMFGTHPAISGFVALGRPSNPPCHHILSLSGRLTGRLKTRQKAVLHEACSGPLAGLAAGRDARGDAVMSAPRMHMSELRGHSVPVLVVVASELVTILKKSNVKLALVQCGAALRGSGSQQR